jgi:hypothetical protein
MNQPCESITFCHVYYLYPHFSYVDSPQTTLNHNNFLEEYLFLGCDVVWFLLEPTFRGNVSPPFSGCKNSASYEQCYQWLATKARSLTISIPIMEAILPKRRF